MLRFGILAAVLPLALVGGVARDWTQASARQCFGPGLAASSPRSIAFTTDPSAATVRVQIVERAELADLAIADGVEVADAGDCGLSDIAGRVAISAQPRPGEPLVYVSRDADADYRIYVDSTTISAEQAAAMIVGARGGHTRLAAQPLASEITGSISR
jgi:hypothetical protein